MSDPTLEEAQLSPIACRDRLLTRPRSKPSLVMFVMFASVNFSDAASTRLCTMGGDTTPMRFSAVSSVYNGKIRFEVAVQA